MEKTSSANGLPSLRSGLSGCIIRLKSTAKRRNLALYQSPFRFLSLKINDLFLYYIKYKDR